MIIIMELGRLSILTISIILFSLSHFVNCRIFDHSKHINYRILSQISFPPSYASEASMQKNNYAMAPSNSDAHGAPMEANRYASAPSNGDGKKSPMQPNNYAVAPSNSDAHLAPMEPNRYASAPSNGDGTTSPMQPNNSALAPTNSDAHKKTPTLPSPALAPANNNTAHKETIIFNVKSYGAVGNGVADDTKAFKKAWDAACQIDSTVVLVPNRQSFMIQSTIFTGPCKPGITFQIDGTIMPPDGPKKWAKGNSKKQWLVFYRINGMSMQGDGLIDGRGQKWWDLPCKPHNGANKTTTPGPCDSPVAIRFFMSSNLTIRGIRIKNSPQFHFRFDGCHDVHIDSMNIIAPALSPNTDGIHIENSYNVQIYNSLVSNGDDCVSIGAGTFNVDIRNITCGPSHGISIGSLGIRNSQACVTNITVQDSVIKHSDNGVRIKTWQGGFGAVSKVTFKNIHMDTVRNPVMIDQYYCSTKSCPNQTSAVYVSDIVYSNIKGTYDVRSPPMHLGCSDYLPCTNLTFSDVELLPAQGPKVSKVLNPFCWNAYGNLKTVTIPPVFCLLEGVPDSLPSDGVDRCSQ